MKDVNFTRCVAVTVDQRRSRRGPDRVPALIEALVPAVGAAALLPPERTAGDEVQLLVAHAAAAVDAVATALRHGGWWIGVGLGAVEAPLPNSTRAARGDAYVAARRAVEDAHLQPSGLAVRTVGGAPYGGAMSPETRDAETSLMLLGELYQRRTDQGWQVVDLLASGASVAEAARRLGVSPSAVSQRHRRAAWELEGRTRELCTDALDRALRKVAA